MITFLKKACRIASGAVVLFAAVSASGAAEPEKEINSVLASVNGEAITLFDVLPLTRAREFQAAAVYSGDRLREAVTALRSDAVEELIDRKLILGDYRRQPFEIASRDVESELDAMAERLGCRGRAEFSARLRAEGTTLDEVRQEIRERIIVQLMLSREFRIGESVTPRELREYFDARREEFATKESVELVMIRVPRSRAEFEKTCAAVAEKLAADAGSFDALADDPRVSDAPEGGRLGVIELKRLRVEFASALNPIESGGVYGPVDIEDARVWLKVIRHIPAGDGNFSERAPEIRKQLERERFEAGRKAYCARLREQAVIRYFMERDEEVKSDGL